MIRWIDVRRWVSVMLRTIPLTKGANMRNSLSGLYCISRLLCISGGLVFFFGTSPAGNGVEANSRVLRQLCGRVIDEAGHPVADCRVVLWEQFRGEPRLSQEARTGVDGRFCFAQFQSKYVSAGIRDERWAYIYRECSEDIGKADEIVFRAVPPVRGKLRITDPDGSPLSGARLRVITVASSNYGKTSFWNHRFAAYEFANSKSDESGMLLLPPLVGTDRIDAVVEHDDWAAASVSSFVVEQGSVAPVRLQPGVKVEFTIPSVGSQEMNLEGETLRTRLYPHLTDMERVLVDSPIVVKNRRFQICAHPGTYSFLRICGDGIVLTPHLGGNSFRIAEGENDRIQLLARPTIPVHGRIISADSSELVSFGNVCCETANLAVSGAVEIGNGSPWVFLEWVSLDTKGEFTARLPPGKGRISVDIPGRIAEQAYYEINVAPEQENQFADILVRRPPVIEGIVLNSNGHPASGAIVRVYNSSLRWMPSVRTDGNGHFRIELSSLPCADDCEQPTDLLLGAFLPRESQAAAEAKTVLRNDSQMSVSLQLEPRPANWLLNHYRMQMTPWERGEITDELRAKIIPASQRGNVPPELDCVEWLNVPDGQKSLADFRGKYVLVDFWTCWCGPCHAQFPMVKLVRELFGDRVEVIGFHDNSVPVEKIREHAKQRDLDFPIAIDHADGRTFEKYKELGMTGFPSYFLLDPEGKILFFDDAVPGPTLSNYKVELMRELLLKEMSE